MHTVLLIAALFATVFATTEREYISSFVQWQETHNVQYSTYKEYLYRFSVFKSNMDFVNNFDSKARGFTVALNKFSDLTVTEFASIYNGMNITKNISTRITPVDASIPTSFNWNDHGAVTPIKNQGQCGSCWSFSATGSTEGAHFLKTKNLVSLSEQNLVDCSVPQGNQGCNGGLMDQAFEYIISNGGIDTEASYPYTATGPNQCQYNAANSAATLTSYHDIPSGSESALLAAIVDAPVSVAIDASHQSFQMYQSGVYYEPSCSSTQLDHGVLAIGWGTDSGSDYYIVKNSWGTSWGQQGFIWMSRNKNNNCGIATSASYPIV